LGRFLKSVNNHCFTIGLPVSGSPSFFRAMKSFVIALSLLSSSLYSQVTFNIQFDQEFLWNSMPGITEADSFYLGVGNWGSPWTYDTAIIWKISKAGDFISNKKINFYPGSKLYDIVSSPNDSERVEISGLHHAGIDDVVNTDLLLGRFNVVTMDTILVKSFGAADYGDYSTSLIYRTSDNGIVLTGYRFAPDQKGKLLLLKTDSLLNQVFMKTYSKSNLDNHFGYGVIETPGKGFIVVGSRSFNQYDRQGTYLRVDSLGNQIWWKDIVPQGDEEFIVFHDIVRLENGAYLVLGIKQYFNPGFPRYMVHLILSINEEGEVLWSKEYGSDIYNDAGWRGLTLCLDGNYITGGTTRENQYIPNRKAYGTIAKISPSGEVLWERKYSASTEGQLYDVFWRTIPTSDGGIIACGSTWGDSITKENSWIVKLDSLGCLEPGCDSISTGVVELPVGDNSPIKIYPNPTGGQLTIEAQGGRLITALKIYDLQGRRLKDEVFKPGRGSLSLDLSGEPPGMYFCTALVGGVWVTRQFILKN